MNSLRDTILIVDDQRVNRVILHDFDKLDENAAVLATYRGSVGNAASLLKYLRLRDETWAMIDKLLLYAELSGDEDISSSKRASMLPAREILIIHQEDDVQAAQQKPHSAAVAVCCIRQRLHKHFFCPFAGRIFSNLGYLRQ